MDGQKLLRPPVEVRYKEELEALKGTYYKLQELQTKALQLKSETGF